MRPLLVAINAKYIHTNNAVRLLKANSAFDVDIVEFTIKDDYHHILKTIQSYQSLFIGFSTYIWNIEIIKQLARDLTPTPIVFGGPEVSYDAQAFLDYADIIVKGEGEMVLDAVIKHFKFGHSLSKVYSITTKEINHSIEEIKDLSHLKSPFFLEEDSTSFKHRIAYIESSRGCPYKCTYCLSSLEKTVRFFPFDHVIEQLKRCQKLGVKTFKFLDRTFNANKQMPSIIEWIITHHRPGTVYQFEITGDHLNSSWINAIHDKAPSGLFRFEIGIQSVHTSTNQWVERNQDIQKLFTMIKHIQNANIIELHLDLIAGLPGENLAMFKESFDQVFALGAKELQLGFLKMLRGTKIRTNASKFNYRFDLKPPYEIIDNNTLSVTDLSVIKHVEIMLNIFHNKGFFKDFVYVVLSKHFESYFDAFKAMYDTFIKTVDPHDYQLDTLFAFLHEFLEVNGVLKEDLDALKYIYLLRAKVKPKCYFPVIHDKAMKQKLFEKIAKNTHLTVNQLFKHSIVTSYRTLTLVVCYQNHKATGYILKKEASSYVLINNV